VNRAALLHGDRSMNARQRFQRIMRYERVARLPVVAFEPYELTGVARWRTEGLPPDRWPDEYLGLDVIRHVPLNLYPIPPFEERVLSETATDYIQVDALGTTVRRLKEAPTMYYGHIGHPVKDMEDWKAYAERFSAASEGRACADIESVAASLNASEAPVGLCLYPFFFRLGFYSMGMERFLTAFYDQPALVHAMFSFWSDFVLAAVRPLLSLVRMDFVVFAEDLAYRGGPHVSPRIYEQFWLPYQDLIVEELRRADVPLICMWSSGNLVELIPLLMEHGFNCTWPLEQAAGMDPAMLRRRFGRELRLGGGFAKEALIAGPREIEREIRRLMPVVEQGGFVPAVDDVVPPEVPFENYRYYVNAMRAISLQ
jgi:uroporphyrinogen decarboxylase